MKRQGIISDFIFQVFALIISVILVHAVYVAVIRPNADAILTQQATLQAADPEFVAPVSIYIVLRDLEQESCLMLMLWAVAIMGLKIHRNRVENKLLDRQLRLKAMPRLRFAGQVTGVEGYVESAAMGLLTGRLAAGQERGYVGRGRFRIQGLARNEKRVASEQPGGAGAGGTSRNSRLHSAGNACFFLPPVTQP
jgi:hypothetical protein